MNMQVTVNVPDQLQEEARARGVSVEVYVEEILAKQLPVPEKDRLDAIGAAIDRIRELRKNNALSGLRLKDLLHEGHKY